MVSCGDVMCLWHVQVGDIIEVSKQDEEGWWEGEFNGGFTASMFTQMNGLCVSAGKTGIFPSNFVELVAADEDAPSRAPPVAAEDDDAVSCSCNCVVGVSPLRSEQA